MRAARPGLTLACDVHGAGDETIVLTHGLGQTGAAWAPVVPALAARRRVVTWDLRAHGRSGSPAAACTLSDLAADLAAVVETTAGGPVHVVGHSAGGVVAMRFALDVPARIRSLVLVGSSSECNARAAARYEKLAATAEREGGSAVLARLGVRDPAAPPPDGAGFAHVARTMGALHGAPITAALASLDRPVLVVVGERDPMGVGGSVIISRQLARGRLEIVPGRGHAIFEEDPAGFVRLVEAFLDRL